MTAKMETSEKVSIFARLNVKGGIPSPLHNPPMRVQALLQKFVYSLTGIPGTSPGIPVFPVMKTVYSVMEMG